MWGLSRHRSTFSVPIRSRPISYAHPRGRTNSGFFFEIVMPAKDAWGAAFYCGTSAGFRAEALLVTQGMATETVTEDTHTSFKMEEHGYCTIYLKAAQHGARPGRVARLYHPALPLVPWRHSADLHARLPGEHACARSATCRLSMARSIGSSLFLSRSSC